MRCGFFRRGLAATACRRSCRYLTQSDGRIASSRLARNVATRERWCRGHAPGARPFTRRVGALIRFHQSAKVGQFVVQPRAPDRSSTSISAARRRAAFRSLNPVLRSYRRPSITLRRNRMSPRRLNLIATPFTVRARAYYRCRHFCTHPGGVSGGLVGQAGAVRKGENRNIVR